MKFVLWNTFTAGLAGTVALTVIVRASRLTGLTRMPRFRDLVGSAMSEDHDLVRIVGRVGHFLVGIAFFGPLYGLVFANADHAAWTLGATAGIAHAVVAGLVLVPLVSLRGSRNLIPPDESEVSPGETIVVPPGGVFGIRWGALTPFVIVAAHVAYGIAAALTYGAIAPLRRF